MSEDKLLNGDIEKSNLSLEQKIKIQKLRWKNRRLMAWLSVISLIAIIILFFFAPIDNERLKIIATPICTMSFVFGGVIASYMGFSTYESGKLQK